VIVMILICWKPVSDQSLHRQSNLCAMCRFVEFSLKLPRLDFSRNLDDPNNVNARKRAQLEPQW
jgi:hypothetical protein